MWVVVLQSYELFLNVFYLHIISGSVISELSEQLSQESFSCCPREEVRGAAGESGDPVGPVQRHYHSDPDASARH